MIWNISFDSPKATQSSPNFLKGSIFSTVFSIIREIQSYYSAPAGSIQHLDNLQCVIGAVCAWTSEARCTNRDNSIVRLIQLLDFFLSTIQSKHFNYNSIFAESDIVFYFVHNKATQILYNQMIWNILFDSPKAIQSSISFFLRQHNFLNNLMIWNILFDSPKATQSSISFL